jgi:hypothetical protein
MLTTAQLPPGYQVPPHWTYVIVLGVSILWESRFKGSKTYAPSGFLPDILYGEIAAGLWVVLCIFAHVGQLNGWFPIPPELDKTLITCLLLLGVQKQFIKNTRKPEEDTKEDPQPAQANHPAVQTPSPSASPAVSRSKPVPKRRLSKNNESAQKLLDYVRQNGQAKTGALVEALGSPRRTVIRNLNKLLEEGRLVREGSGPGAVYRLKDSPKAEEQK